ncbi:MAG: hypothetical protein AUJ92_05380 [Armatimonadetes bacterium CG2_30_59_28]|nr:MAG: hypothetical protein AUJ92_05380 [Armatimonadetes bacterium CG2_30_59_28]PIU63901.1 MAG: hypothetical protein COS85_14615 [Armatimonadetes bacterium CG07_land_8_20_14_0_80_59_28]PIY45948.1 MAG: hypothetical protein COZ05_06100 [Armatimonadetes bacterium CG_4_10_14_3_um_filter_59_10]
MKVSPEVAHMPHVKRTTTKPYREREADRKATIRLRIAAIVGLVLLAVGLTYGPNRFAKKMQQRSDSSSGESVEDGIPKSGGFFRRLAPKGRGGGSSGGRSASEEDPGTACRKKLESIRKLSREYERAHGAAPPSLGSMGVSQGAAVCPESKEVYVYAPASGQVSCPHSKHITY